MHNKRVKQSRDWNRFEAQLRELEVTLEFAREGDVWPPNSIDLPGQLQILWQLVRLWTKRSVRDVGRKSGEQKANVKNDKRI